MVPYLEYVTLPQDTGTVGESGAIIAPRPTLAPHFTERSAVQCR